MSEQEFRILKTNACSKVGRPQKGFGTKKRIADSEPITFVEYLKSSFNDIETAIGTVTLGLVTDGIWQEYESGMGWNCVKSQFPGKDPKYRSLKSFENEYNTYVENFYTRKEAILARCC